MLVARYGAVLGAIEDFGPRYNIAPTMPVIAALGRRDGVTLETCSWGLVPAWARDRSGAAKLINARVETLTERPTFRPLVAHHRCIIAMDGFYEWGPDRRPRFIVSGSSDVLDVAGLWTTWKDPDLDRAPLVTCTIVTTEAVGELAAVHHRMPLALTPEDCQSWLAPEALEPGELEAMVATTREWCEADLQMYEVSRDVNRVGRQDPALIEPVAPPPDQGQLFAT